MLYNSRGLFNEQIRNEKSHCGSQGRTDVGVLRLLAVFAFGLGAATFLGAGAFLGSATFAGAFFGAVAFFLETAVLAAASFCKNILEDSCTLSNLEHNKPWWQLASSQWQLQAW